MVVASVGGINAVWESYEVWTRDMINYKSLHNKFKDWSVELYATDIWRT